MTGRFPNAYDSVIEPSRRCRAITPSDTVALTEVPKAFYVGTGGDVTLIASDDTDPVTFMNVPDGGLVDVRPKKIMATGTTASNIVGLF